MIANNVWYRLALLWCGALLVTVMAQGAAPVPQAKAKLAILPLQAELESTADLLSVSLGKQSNVELVERQQIKKVLHELALGGAQAQNQLKLGEVLSADGLLFLDRLKKDNREFLSLKFVAVKPGVVIHRNEVPWPLTEPLVWSAFAAEQYASLVPKLFVRKEEAIPVSLLSLHSSVITPETIALDRQLTDLLARNLMAQPKIFVLERQRLERLAYEKDWQATNETFWNGAMVVEGVINPEGMTPGEIKIKARLAPHEGKPVDVVVEGKRDQLAELVNRLTFEVAQVLRTSADKSTWNPVAESLKYSEEASWQMRWGFAAEAQQAAESAWALGLRTPAMATLRVDVYAKFLINFYPNWFNGIPTNKVTAEHVYYCRRALENYLELNQDSGTNAPPEWLKYGENLLNLASMHLNHVNLAGQRDGLKRNDLRPVREKVRELAKFLERSNPVSTQAKLLNGKLPGYPGYAVILMNYGGLWEETYAAGLKHFERGVKAGYYLPLLSKQNAGVPCGLRRTAWGEENLLDCEDQWQAMLARLQKDTNKLVQLSGYVMGLKTADSDYQFEDTYRELWGFLKENVDLLIDGELPIEVVGWLVEPRGNAFAQSSISDRKRDAFVLGYKKDFEPWRIAAQAAAKKREDAAKVLEEEQRFADLISRLEQLTKDKKPFKMGDFFPLNVPLDLIRAEKLLAAVTAYEATVPSAASSTGYLRSQIQMVYSKAGKTMPARVPSVILAPSPEAMKLAKKAPPVPVSKGPEQSAIRLIEIKDVPRAPKENVQTNSTLLNMPVPVIVTAVMPKKAEVNDKGWKQWKLMDGKLWVETWCNVSEPFSSGNSYGYKSFTVRSLVEVNLSPPHAQTVHYSVKGERDYLAGHLLNSHMIGGPPLAGDLSTFTQYKGKLYRMDEGKVWEESAVGLWFPMSWDVPGASKLAVVHDRLFANTSESLLELVPATGEVKVLASARNKPARTLLDNLPDLNQALLFAGPQGAIRVAVGDNIFQLPANGKDWQRITSFIPHSRYKKVSRDGLLFEAVDANRAVGFSALLPGNNEFTELLSLIAPRLPGARSAGNTGYWRWTMEELVVDRAARTGVLDGRDFWLLYGPVFVPERVKPTIDENYQLIWYSADNRDPLMFKPKFAPDSLAVMPGLGMGPGADLLVDDKHIVMAVPSESKAFVLDKAALKSLAGPQTGDREALRKERLAYLEKRKKMWEKMYDSNQNEKLEPGEETMMLKNRQVQKDLEELKLLNERKP